MANSHAASAISVTRRWPSASRAVGTWATATVNALASSSSPMSRGLRPRSAPAYGGTSQVNTPQPTAIIATLVRARPTKARSRTTSRYPPATGSGRASSRTRATRMPTYTREVNALARNNATNPVSAVRRHQTADAAADPGADVGGDPGDRGRPVPKVGRGEGGHERRLARD